MKPCYQCNEKKNLKEFYKNKGMLDGHLNLCKSCHKIKNKEWRKKNPNCRSEEYERAQLRLGNGNKEERLAKRKANNKGRNVIACEYQQRRKLKLKVHAMSEFDKFICTEAYRLAQLREQYTNIKWHVDHIVPINYKGACGLHNGFNLQVVPAYWNIAKKHLNMDTYFLQVGRSVINAI